jgi:large subunit ribosomal protein L32
MSGGLPKKRKPRGRSNQRRSHIRLASVALSKCPKCGTMRPTFSACPTCGTYQGRTVIDIAAKEAKRLEKEKERKRQATEEGRT